MSQKTQQPKLTRQQVRQIPISTINLTTETFVTVTKLLPSHKRQAYALLRRIG